MLKQQGKLEEAEPLSREALEGMREVHGPRHPSTLIAVDNLATLLVESGRTEEETRLRSEYGV